MKKQFLSFGLLILLLAASLQAQAQSEVSINRRTNGLKNASQARSIALTNTIMPIAVGYGTVALFENNTLQSTGAFLAAYGLLMGPSTGNFYALDYPRGVIGLTARAVGSYLMVDATSEIFGREFASALYVDDRDVSLTDTKILIGEALVLGSIIYNIWSTKSSVKEYNNSQRRFSLNVTPAVIENKVAPLVTANIHL